MNKRFSGVVVPMITPLQDDGSPDTVAVGGLMRLFHAHGLHPLVLGTTGESPSFSKKEGFEVMSAAALAKGAGQYVYAGMVGTVVRRLVKKGNAYLDMGADAVVATLPPYYPLTPEQMAYFFLVLADSLRGPLLVYNIKATTGMSLPLEVIETLSQHPNILGIKDSERDETRMMTLIEQYKDRPDFSYFCGWGAKGAESLLLGADGIVPSTANLVPALYERLYAAVTAGQLAEAERLQALTDQVAAVYQGGMTLGESLAALKCLMHAQGRCGTAMKPPLTLLDTDKATHILETYAALLTSHPEIA
ncbi:MAG TPA: dihydrodipicolinate synthase family protein [Bacteroidales bacterium]|jgi:4-hydroxy-tetrahydrodipicolinate synthase|nr:MAG: N-acetylneuraminate lyase [Bacteroidetes bacterium ADurb.Bin416]HBL71656.1 dihydrodipicolinate synthase family protein [Bacteroidales bacterium]